MTNLDHLIDENTNVKEGAMTVSDLIESMSDYPLDAVVAITFLGPDGNLSEYGLDVLAIVDNGGSAEDRKNTTVVGFVLDISEEPYHIPTEYPNRNN